ncbi:Nicotine blue oxidoreductase [bioreactor metagenome]|uniref:Nicotine blue oxidoreductase n=1 Tax=bioreactor metagenome TaxID=1076179 RepID=A0A644XWK0_9ZZZZ
MRLGCVLMASGFGKRFGGNKLLAVVEGKTLLRRTMEAIPPSLFDRAAVVSQYEEVLSRASGKGYLSIFNPGAAEGISASLRLGLEAMGDMDGILFAVCDQPWLTKKSVVRLIRVFRDHPDRITALSYEKKRGNPVIFPAGLFPELNLLRGEDGGRTVISWNPNLLMTVEASSARELMDVDYSQ